MANDFNLDILSLRFLGDSQESEWVVYVGSCSSGKTSDLERRVMCLLVIVISGELCGHRGREEKRVSAGVRPRGLSTF